MKKMFIFLWVFIFLTACSDKNKSQIENFKYEVESLKIRLSVIENFITIDKYNANDKAVIFKPGSNGFASLSTNIGYLFISLDNISKYADGYKVSFFIGNPNVVNIKDLKLNIKYGKSFVEGGNFKKWQDSLKSQIVTVDKVLLPGVWNKITIVLSPATASETGFISLSASVDGIYMSEDRR